MILIFIVFIAVNACNKKDGDQSPDQLKNLRLKTITGEGYVRTSRKVGEPFVNAGQTLASTYTYY